MITEAARADVASRTAPPANLVTIQIVDSRSLPLFEQPWTDLAKTAVAANPFYEPWMLLPALKSIENKKDPRFLLVFGPAGRNGAAPLWGFFPLETQPTCMKLPIPTLAFWQHHRYFYLSVPLIHCAHVWEVLEAFWKWFERNPFGCQILDTKNLLADGQFHEVWADFTIGRSSFTVIEFPREFLKPSGAAPSYILNAISKKRL